LRKLEVGSGNDLKWEVGMRKWEKGIGKAEVGMGNEIKKNQTKTVRNRNGL
jgi:hypothetical protein